MEAIRIVGKVVEIDKGIMIVPISEQDLQAISKKLEDEATAKQEKVEIKELPILVEGKRVKKIYAYGDVATERVGTEECLSHYIRKIIPNVEVMMDKVPKHSYKCFAGIPFLRNNMIQHEDAGSAINCLMSVLKEPQRVLIFS